MEKDDENFADLKRHTAHFLRWVEIYHGEFSEWADNIINRIGKKAALVFLDAFGVKGRIGKRFVNLSRARISPMYGFVLTTEPYVD